MYAQCSVSVLMSLLRVSESKCVSVLCASFLSARRSSRKTEFNHREQWHIPCDQQPFWPKPHVEYHSPRWTNWKPLSVLPILPVCEWVRSYGRDLFETCCVAFPVGFLWITKQWQTICIIGLWRNEEQGNWLVSFNRGTLWVMLQTECVKQKGCNQAKTKHYVLHPFNQQKCYALYLDYMITQPLSWRWIQLERSCTYTHTFKHEQNHTHS